MTFPEDVVKQAWQRSSGQCECTRRTHRHFYTPCGKSLTWEKRGQVTAGGWEAHQTTSFGGDALSNCEILCWECHEATY